MTQKQAQLKSSLTETKEKLEMIQQNGKKFQEVLAKEQPKMYQLMNQVQQLRARQKSLQEIQENYFGFTKGYDWSCSINSSFRVLSEQWLN